MDYKSIESLKSALMQRIQKGCIIKNSIYGVHGRIVGVGFKPYWTNPADSKIEKLEFNFIDRNGRIRPFYLNNVVGYDVLEMDGERLEDSNNISLDVHIYSVKKSRDSKEPYDKIRIDISE